MMGQPLDFDPGAKHAYSNLGYLVLGRVLEAATGAKYEPWVKKNVLAPVKAAGMSLGKARPERRPKDEVKYYDSKKRMWPCLYPPRVGQRVPITDGGENIEGFEAHGGWVSSAVDLVRFAAALDLRSQVASALGQSDPGDVVAASGRCRVRPRKQAESRVLRVRVERPAGWRHW